MSIALQLIFAINFILVMCTLTYKITIFFGDKILQLYEKPGWGRKILSLIIGLFFAFSSWLLLKDFIWGDHLLSSLAGFPLNLLLQDFAYLQRTFLTTKHKPLKVN